jgi:inhibitor of KinA
LSSLPIITPLSESALSITLGHSISINTHHRILQLQQRIHQQPFAGLTETIPAYTTLTVCYNPLLIAQQNNTATAFAQVKKYIETIWREEIPATSNASAIITLPVCYNGPDLPWLSDYTQLSIADIIQLHTSTVYHVYMLGFLPGFAYMGEVDERISAPRKTTPRTSVPAGSVGIAGRQTGIYPLASPGGWQLIGQCPVPLFNPQRNPPALLQAGSRVQFYPISEAGLSSLQNKTSAQ